MTSFDPLDYDAYRPMIRAWIAAAPNRSQTSLAKRIGTSRSTVAMVLNGKRDIPLPSAGEWAAGLGLSGDQARYFDALVRGDSPLSLAVRRKARSEAIAARDAHRALRPTLAQARLLRKWFVPVILELARTDGFALEPEWLGPRLWPEVDPEELSETCSALRNLKILTAESDGTTLVDPRPLATLRDLDDAELSQLALGYHADQLGHAQRALHEQSSDERHVASLAVSVRKADIPALVDALHRFQLEVIEPFRARDDGDAVVQVSVQLFQRTP